MKIWENLKEGGLNVQNSKWSMLERILIKRNYKLFSWLIGGNMCPKDMHLYVVWVSTYFSIIFFSFLNQVSASLTKAQIPLKLGTPEILCWMRTMQSQAMGPSRAAMVIWYKLQTIVEIPILKNKRIYNFASLNSRGYCAIKYWYCANYV